MHLSCRTQWLPLYVGISAEIQIKFEILQNSMNTFHLICINVGLDFAQFGTIEITRYVECIPNLVLYEIEIEDEIH